MVKRPIGVPASVDDPVFFSSALPSPNTQEMLERQNRMQQFNGGNILYPPRKITHFKTLNTQQSSLADAFLHLENRYRDSGWFGLCHSKLDLPAFLSTREKIQSENCSPSSSDIITPTHAFKHGSQLTDLHHHHDGRNQKTGYSQEYLTRALLRDSLITLGKWLHPRQNRKPTIRNLDNRFSEALQRVSLNEIADEEGMTKRVEGILSPQQSDLDDHISTAYESDDDSTLSESERDLNYEDYF